MAEKWQSKLAGKERCRSIVKSFGVWLTFFAYLVSKEQINLQGLNHWTYETGVPRAIRIVPIRSVHFLSQNKILMLATKNWRDKMTVLDLEIDSWGWLSVQIQQHIFQVNRDSNRTQMLENNGSSKFEVIAKAPIGQIRVEASICNMADQFIFATGGGLDGEDYLSSVERYDFARNFWEEMPSMNNARAYHSSCVLDTALYVFCGENKQYRLFNSVEKLETLELQAGWQLIEIPSTSLLTARELPVVAALNSSEILMMGGKDSKWEFLSDALTFDKETNSVKKVSQEAPLKFSNLDQSAQIIRPGVIVALVKDSAENRKLIEYRSGSIRSLYTFE